MRRPSGPMWTVVVVPARVARDQLDHRTPKVPVCWNLASTTDASRLPPPGPVARTAISEKSDAGSSAASSAAPVGVVRSPTSWSAPTLIPARGDFEHGRHRHRQPPVLSPSCSAAGRQRGAGHRPVQGADLGEPGGATDHVGHGVERAPFVEVHLVGRNAVDRAFGSARTR